MSEFRGEPDAVDYVHSLERRIAQLEGAALGGSRSGRVLGVSTPESPVPISATPSAVGSPLVVVDVPAGALVQIYAYADLYHLADTGFVAVYLFEATDQPSGIALTGLSGGTPSYVRAASSGYFVYPASAGRRTYELRATSSVSIGLIKNQNLWVSVQ